MDTLRILAINKDDPGTSNENLSNKPNIIILLDRVRWKKFHIKFVFHMFVNTLILEDDIADTIQKNECG